MSKTISKSGFKPHALEYFRQVEETGEEIVITNHGKPVLKVVPYRKDTSEDLKSLRNSVLKYEKPFDPVDTEEWEVLR
jgi:prevent-host-death family protein